MKAWAKESRSNRWEIYLYYTKEDAQANRYSFLILDRGSFRRLTQWEIRPEAILEIELTMEAIVPDPQGRLWQ